MRLIPYSPMMDLEEMGFAPAIDVYETKDSVVAEIPVPNLDPEKVDASIENDVLTIQGHSEKKSEVDDESYYRKEVRYGSFHRSIALPVAVQGDKAEAEYKDGVLKVKVPKAPAAKHNKIKIKTIKK